MHPSGMSEMEIVVLYVREDIPDKVIHCDFLAAESSSVEINLHKKK